MVLNTWNKTVGYTFTLAYILILTKLQWLYCIMFTYYIQSCLIFPIFNNPHVLRGNHLDSMYNKVSRLSARFVYLTKNIENLSEHICET